jgi:hypothetical protein
MAAQEADVTSRLGVARGAPVHPLRTPVAARRLATGRHDQGDTRLAPASNDAPARPAAFDARETRVRKIHSI